MGKTIRVSRTWKIKDYESYRVSAEDEVPEGVDVVTVARQLSLECHGAYNDYLLLVQGGFTQASNLPLRDGAEQGRETADSPTPAAEGAGAGAGAEDPGVPPAKGPGSVTESQLEALATLGARSARTAEFLRKALIRLKARRVEQIGTEAAAALIGRLNRLGPEDEA